MTDPIPPAIERYFSGRNTRDFDRALSAFAHDAVVRDEGETRSGPAAIRAWMEETAAKYDDRSDITGVSADSDSLQVTALVSGTFPGSPASLTYRFTLADGLITRLEIA